MIPYSPIKLLEISNLIPSVFLRHNADHEAEWTHWYTSIKSAKKMGRFTPLWISRFAKQR